MIATQEPLRLNLGGAGEGFMNGRLIGFKTVDLREGPETDIVSNVKDLSFCADDSVSDLYSSNVLEHFPHTETVSVLKEWCRVLIPGHRLWLSVPDFAACLRLYKKHGLIEWVGYLIWGDQKHPLNYHYINFDEPYLASLLKEAGFSQSERIARHPWGQKDASGLGDNVDRLPISLNMVATK